MEVISIDSVAKKDDSHRAIFEGQVSVQPLATKDLAEDPGLVMVNFSPGAKTKLHTHTHDQVPLVTGGRGILAIEDKENIVTPGMLVYVRPGEKHWHGATKDSSFSHINIHSPGETHIVE